MVFCTVKIPYPVFVGYACNGLVRGQLPILYIQVSYYEKVRTENVTEITESFPVHLA